MSKKNKLSNDELIQKIEAIDESVLPDKEEILRRLRAGADSYNKNSSDSSLSDNNISKNDSSDNDSDSNSGNDSISKSVSEINMDAGISSVNSNNSNNTSKGSNKVLLSVGMFFQFIFTVLGGGMFISGLISGFSVKWDTSVKDGVANISIFLSIIGGIFFAVGIILIFVLYKLALKGYLRSKLR